MSHWFNTFPSSSHTDELRHFKLNPKYTIHTFNGPTQRDIEVDGKKKN